MARRRSTSLADDIMDMVSLLPWWVGVVLAIVSYAVLSSLTARPVQATGAGGPAGGTATSALILGIASALKYVLPILCLVGAGVSAYRRRQRTQLLASASSSTAVVDGMRWQEFEMLVGEAFRQQGYQIVETGGGGADGGVDLVLSRPAQNGGEKTLVQCKQWRASKVGVDVVRELYGVMAARGAATGIVVTSGQFTAEAQAFAYGRNVRLIDGPALEGLIRPARSQASQRPTRSQGPAARRAAEPAEPAPAAASSAPACPACGKAMVPRTAKRGTQAGNRFWGCTGFPACRGTRSMDER